MRRILLLLALCLASTTALAQQVESTEQPPPLPLTGWQLYVAQDEAVKSARLVSYDRHYIWETLDAEGRVTGSRRGSFHVLRLDSRVRVTRSVETPSTLQRLITFERSYAHQLVRFFSPFCPVRLSGYELRQGKPTLRYRTTYAGTDGCFDGLVWVGEKGLAVEADGRFEPHRFYEDGRERVAARAHFWMNEEGLPVRVAGEDILAFASQKDKNGGALRVRARFEITFTNYERPRTGEPKVIEQGDVEP